VKTRTQPRVAVVFNRDFEDAGADPENRAREDIQDVALEVTQVLQRAGLDVMSVGLREDLYGSIRALGQAAPAVVFNLCESLQSDNRFEALLPMLLEYEGLVYTGSPPQTLLSALHKDRAKKLLLACGVPTPPAVVLDRPDTSAVDLAFPLIVKPTREDASVGIASSSVVYSREELDSRVRFILAHYRQPALVEGYVEGREINVSVLESADGGPPTVLPLHEIDFSEMPDDRPKIVSFEGKWVEGSVDYRGTRPVRCDLAPAIEQRVREVALAAFSALELRDYGRVDVRLSADGTPWVIDVNPNCDLSRQGAGFSRAAQALGLSYDDLILRLLALAMKRRQDADTIPLGQRSRTPRRDHRASGGKPDGEPLSPGGSGLRHRAPRGGAGSAGG
jgi:D-alanine-D-alanine ligase